MDMIYLNRSLKNKRKEITVSCFTIRILDINFSTISPLVYYDEARKRAFNAMYFVATNLNC